MWYFVCRYDDTVFQSVQLFYVNESFVKMDLHGLWEYEMGVFL